MATFFYQSNPNTTKQSWLANNQVCLSCLGQKPKQYFRVYNDEEICQECYKEELLDQEQ
jgi:hypothetical protein